MPYNVQNPNKGGGIIVRLDIDIAVQFLDRLEAKYENCFVKFNSNVVNDYSCDNTNLNNDIAELNLQINLY